MYLHIMYLQINLYPSGSIKWFDYRARSASLQARPCSRSLTECFHPPVEKARKQTEMYATSSRECVQTEWQVSTPLYHVLNFLNPKSYYFYKMFNVMLNEIRSVRVTSEKFVFFLAFYWKTLIKHIINF